MTTNQLDDESLEAMVRASERAAANSPLVEREDFEIPPPQFEYPRTTIFSDATYNLTTEARGQIVRSVMAPAEAQGMLSAGYLEVRGNSAGFAFPGHDMLYAEMTQGQCSMTVRDSTGTGSGWAGLASYDWSAIDAGALGRQALEKCIASRNPVALEPGRYTVILEPQAVHDLVRFVLETDGGHNTIARDTPEGRSGGPYGAGFDATIRLGRSKLGMKIVDERVTISHDPTDPALGVIPFAFGSYAGWPYRPVTWIDHGVLTALEDYRPYALRTRNDNLALPYSYSFRMSGGETSVEEMIRTTKRGLVVTRFSNIRLLDGNSLLATGLTRDGLWLVENGKISKAVKNFRFTESPLFVLNSLEQLGTPVPVFRTGGLGPTPAIVPPLKARDFSFTSTIDAI